jgi:hypothetical protein
MPSKQMEIVVQARDQASVVFNQVGDSAQGLGSKLGSLNDLAEAGHGMHSMLRQARNVAIAFEVVPVAVDAVKAAFATLTGSAEEAAVGQRKLFDAIKEFPVIGKIAAEGAEWASAAIAHAFGKQSTAEIEAEMAKKKAILEDFATSAKKFKEELGKEDDEAAIAGLLPSEAAVVKAKQEYAKKLAEIKEFGGKIIKAAGEGQDVAEATAEAGRMRVDAENKLNAAIAAAHSKQLEEENEFTNKLEDAQRQRNEALAELINSANIKQLEAEGKGFQARIDQLQTELQKQLATIQSNKDKFLSDLDKQSAELQPKADAGDATAKSRLEDIGIDRARAEADADKQEKAARAGEAAEERASRDKELQQAKLEILKRQADAGNQSAKAELEQSEETEKQKTLENALLDILHDQHATQEQQIQAQKDLNDLKAAQKADEAKKLKDHLQSNDDDLAQTKIDMLRQEGELGDKNAEREAKKLEIQKQYNDEKKRLLAILNDEKATEEQKSEAKDLLGHIDSDEAKAESQIGKGKDSQAQLASLDASQYLTGVEAKAEQEKSDPLVDIGKQQVTALEDIASKLSDWLGGRNKIENVTQLR